MNSISHAMRFHNAMKVALNDAELQQLAMDSFNTVLLSTLRVPSGQLAISVFNDDSSLVVCPSQVYMVDDAASLFKCLSTIFRSHPELKDEFRQYMKQVLQ